MGFEPLPFDPRNACFCRQNCPSFRQPTSRWWLVWSNPPPTIPEIGTGILVEFATFDPPTQACVFAAVTLPPGAFSVSLTIVPVAPIPGPTIKRQCVAVTNVGASLAENSLDNEECNIPLNIPGVPPNDPFGGCNIFPVRWYENANDVPH